MPDHSIRAVPSDHPLHNVTGDALFNEVFAHLSKDAREAKLKEYALARDAAAEGAVLTSIHYDDKLDKIVYSFEQLDAQP